MSQVGVRSVPVRIPRTDVTETDYRTYCSVHTTQALGHEGEDASVLPTALTVSPVSAETSRIE